MKNFTSKVNLKTFKKLIIAIILVIVIITSSSGTVKAKDVDAGGVLLNPICDLLVFLGDSFNNLIHSVIYQSGWVDTTITVDTTNSLVEVIGMIILGVVVAVAIAAIIIFTAGIAAEVAGAILGVSLTSLSVGTILMTSVVGGVAAVAIYAVEAMPDTIKLPVYQISPEEIFSNKLSLLDVDFFNPKEDTYVTDSDGNPKKDSAGNPIVLESTAKQLRGIISNWYIVIRNIAVVALLSILVYIGIRILISSTSSDKSKYKQMLGDWVVAMCLLFVMQYIMSFSNLLVGKVTEVLSDTKYNNEICPLIPDVNGKISETLENLGYEVDPITDETGQDYILWNTNLMGLARLNSQMYKTKSVSYAGYAIIFLVLILFTIYFIFTYLKRVLYMAFLTIIAPFVAMTYPIDKINDGKAQAFNMWFKEYIFNLLIQPMHLILYTVLVSSAFELASSNIIYSLVAIGFMIPAEKLLRKFFGFEKAHTPGLLAGPAGAALMMSGLSKIMGKGANGGKSRGKGSGGTAESADSGPKFKNDDFDTAGELFANDEENAIPMVDSTNSLPSPNSDVSVDNSNAQNRQQKESQTRMNNANATDEAANDKNSTDMEEQLTRDLRQNNGSEIPKTQSEKPKLKNKVANMVSKADRRMARNISVAKYRAAGTIRNLARKTPKITANGIARTAAGMAGATALGMAGLAVGISSGDLSKTFQYTAGTVAGGYKLGTGIKEKLDELTPEDMDEVKQRAKYDTDEEYENAKRKKYIKDFQKNEKNVFELERIYGASEAKKLMTEDVPTLMNYGVTDMNDMQAIFNMRNEGIIKDINEGIAMKKVASRIGTDTTKMTHKNREDWAKTFAEEYKNKEKFSGQDHEKMGMDTIRKVDAFNKAKNAVLNGKK